MKNGFCETGLTSPWLGQVAVNSLEDETDRKRGRNRAEPAERMAWVDERRAAIGSDAIAKADALIQDMCDRAARANARSYGELTITPAMAMALYDRNSGNRHVRTRYLKIAEDILQGRYTTNGETIIISRCGSLNDGQHRMLAVLWANKSIVTACCVGAERSTRETVDVGSARTVGDFLHMRGVTNAAKASAMVNYLWQYHKNRRFVSGTAARPTAQQALHLAESDPLIIDSVKTINATAARSLGGHAILATCYHIFRQYDEAMAKEFMVTLVDGIDVKKGSSIAKTRTRLMDKAMPPNAVGELVFKTWLDYLGMWPKSNNYFSVKGELPELPDSDSTKTSSQAKRSKT